MSNVPVPSDDAKPIPVSSDDVKPVPVPTDDVKPDDDKPDDDKPDDDKPVDDQPNANTVKDAMVSVERTSRLQYLQSPRGGRHNQTSHLFSKLFCFRNRIE